MAHPKMEPEEHRRIAAILASGLIAAGKTKDNDVEEALALYQKVAAHISDMIAGER